MSAIALCYHAVSDSWPAQLSITPERLRSQLAILVGRGYSGCTFASLVERPADRLFAATFDDAFISVYELARPILDEFAIPGTLFVPTDYPDSDRPMSWPGIDRWLGGPHEHELAPMSWAQIDELAVSGWEIGSHSASHPRLTEIGDSELARELADSRSRCAEMLNRPCESLAYPYGDVDPRVVAAAGAAGYRRGAALPGAAGTAEKLEWPRVGVYHKDSGLRFKAKLSPAVTRLRGMLGRTGGSR